MTCGLWVSEPIRLFKVIVSLANRVVKTLASPCIPVGNLRRRRRRCPNVECSRRLIHLGEHGVEGTMLTRGICGAHQQIQVRWLLLSRLVHSALQGRHTLRQSHTVEQIARLIHRQITPTMLGQTREAWG
jgi:hypothetical protein